MFVVILINRAYLETNATSVSDTFKIIRKDYWCHDSLYSSL